MWDPSRFYISRVFMEKTTLGGTEVGVNVDMTSKICFALQPL
jgi:hypothetical protein